VKCERYWPLAGKSQDFGTIRVRNHEETEFGGVILRKLSVSLEGVSFIRMQRRTMGSDDFR